MMIKTRDNTNLPVHDTDDIKNLSLLAGKTIKKIVKEKRNLLIFPHCLNAHHDDIDDKCIFTLSENRLSTNNIMGFVSINDTRLTIASRFDPTENDYFLHYLLQRVFFPNIFDFKFSLGNETIYDFLLYLFPYLLNQALKQGIYKTYIRNDYNNEKLKGAIKINDHIRQNTLFRGKIAYTTREYSFDNAVTQLIRHTIEYIKVNPLGAGILSSNNEIRENVRIITENTPSYNKSNRHKVISQNSKILNHPYFTNYSILQRVCLQILRNKKITFGTDKDKIYGILFDGSWLWEEYLNKVFSENKIVMEHPRNKEGKGRDYLFEDGQSIYPDFVKRKKDRKTAYYVGDAKYKHLDRKGDKSSREDYYQLITYMYRYECNKGYLFFPYSGDRIYERIRKIDGITENRLCIELGLQIIQSPGFKEFRRSIKEAEKGMCGHIK